MNSSLLDMLRRNGLSRSVLAVTATLILGALGSGLWELLLKDLFVGLGNITLSFIAWLWTGYVDILHKNIGSADGDLLTLPVYAITVVTFVITPWLLIHKLMRMITKLEIHIQNPEIDDPDSDIPVSERLLSIRKRIFRKLFPLAALTTALFLILNWQLLYTREAGTWAQRTIEIIAPYVTIEERTRLISELRQVESAKQYFALRQSLVSHASRANIKLPKFTPLGEKLNAQPIIPPDVAR
jgi:hypothetical protein